MAETDTTPESDTPIADATAQALDPAKAQFPSKLGEPEVEVAERSADGSQGMKYTKTFLVEGEVAKDSPMHVDNARLVLGEVIQRGLHAKGNVMLDDTRVNRMPRWTTTELDYSVEVAPSAIDHEASLTVTPGNALSEIDPSSDAPARARRAPKAKDEA
jgi:hypothetical protein